MLTPTFDLEPYFGGKLTEFTQVGVEVAQVKKIHFFIDGVF